MADRKAHGSLDFSVEHLPDGTAAIFSFSNYAVKEAEIPAEIDGRRVAAISSFAFFCCGNLLKVTIPDGVTRIGYGAFSGCYRLKSLVIPDSVTEIGCDAFKDCAGLESISIPDGVEKIGQDAFDGCPAEISVRHNTPRV